MCLLWSTLALLFLLLLFASSKMPRSTVPSAHQHQCYRRQEDFREKLSSEYAPPRVRSQKQTANDHEILIF